MIGKFVQISAEWCAGYSDRSYQGWRIFLVLFLFWGGYFLRGYPQPHPDDTVYVGAAVHYAEKGFIWNDMTPGILQGFSIFPYVTFYSWLLGSWLKVFGVSTKIVLLFHFFLNFFHSLLIAQVFKKLRITFLFFMIAIIAYAAFVSELGSRPNTLAFFFLSAGIFLLMQQTRLGDYGGWSALGFSITTLPYMIGFAGSVGLIHLYHRYWAKRHLDTKLMIKEMFILGLSFLTVLTFWGASTQWRGWEWLAAYLKVAQLNATPFAWNNWTDGWYYAWKSISAGWNLLLFGPTYILVVAALFIQILNFRNQSTAARYLTLVFWLGMVLTGLLYSVFFSMIVVHLSFLYCLVLNYLNFKAVNTRVTQVLLLMIFMSVLGVVTMKVLPFAFQKGYDPDKITSIHQYLREHSMKRVILDSNSWRYIFDYRAPNGAVAAEFCIPQAGSSWVAHFRSMQWKKEEDLLILNASYFQSVLPEAGIRATPLQIGSFQLRSLREYFNEIYMVP